MDLSNKGAAFLRSHEGFVDRWYLDPVRIGTIGIGFTWNSSSFRDWWNRNKSGIKFGPGATMTRQEADEALIYLCSREYGKAVNKFLNGDVPQNVFDGMVSPVYNLGPSALNWKWARAAKEKNYTLAASLLRDTGTTAQGVKLRGLVRRRKEEAMLLERGIYTGVAGIVDDVSTEEVLRRNERGPLVAQLIKDLTALGYYKGVQDDFFGPGTEAAVMEFQKANKLTADGHAGPKTLAMIATKLAMIGGPPVSISVPATPVLEPEKPIKEPSIWTSLFAMFQTWMSGKRV